MTDQENNLPELTELEPLEEHSEPEGMESFEPLTEEKPKAAAVAKQTSKRELEAVPLMLRKASTILLVGALTPWWVAFKGVGDDGIAIPYIMLFAAKAIALVAAYIFHEGFAATHGGKHQGPIATLSRTHKVAVPAVAGVIALLSILFACGVFVDTSGLYPFWAITELFTLLLATSTLTHIFAYEHGGKFNPLFPLVFVGPGIAGVVNLFALSRVLDQDGLMPKLAIAGTLAVAVGGIMAMYTMALALKQAKEQGDRKREAMREHRKATRAANRESRK
jgi:hypothetical protein